MNRLPSADTRKGKLPLGQIIERSRKDGCPTYPAQVRRKKPPTRPQSKPFAADPVAPSTCAAAACSRDRSSPWACSTFFARRGHRSFLERGRVCSLRLRNGRALSIPRHENMRTDICSRTSALVGSGPVPKSRAHRNLSAPAGCGAVDRMMQNAISRARALSAARSLLNLLRQRCCKLRILVVVSSTISPQSNAGKIREEEHVQR